MVIQLSKILDKNGQELTLFQSDTISNTTALPLFLKVYAEIIEKGWCNPTIPFNNSSRVLWAQRKDQSIAGGICYEYNVNTRMAWIILSFTSPNERGKGINSICHNSFENICKKLGATHISSLVHIDNTSRLNSAKKVGLVPQYYRMNKQL